MKLLKDANKNIQRIILILMIFLPLNINAQGYETKTQDTYDSDSLHYFFRIPNEWEETTSSDFEEGMSQIVKIIGEEKVNKFGYTTSFQPKTGKPFTSPYIIIQERETGFISIENAEKYFQLNNLNKVVKDKTSDLDIGLEDIKIGEPTVDNKKKAIITISDVKYENLEYPMRNIMVMFLGKEGIVQLSFYSSVADYEKNLPIFNQVIDSFFYKIGYEYDVGERQANNSMNTDSDIFADLLVGGFVGGLMAGIAYLAKGKRRKVKDKHE